MMASLVKEKLTETGEAGCPLASPPPGAEQARSPGSVRQEPQTRRFRGGGTAPGGSRDGVPLEIANRSPPGFSLQRVNGRGQREGLGPGSRIKLVAEPGQKLWGTPAGGRSRRPPGPSACGGATLLSPSSSRAWAECSEHPLNGSTGLQRLLPASALDGLLRDSHVCRAGPPRSPLLTHPAPLFHQQTLGLERACLAGSVLLLAPLLA